MANILPSPELFGLTSGRLVVATGAATVGNSAFTASGNSLDLASAGTMVVGPSVATGITLGGSATTQINFAIGTAKWTISSVGDLFPQNDNANQLGFNTNRISNVFSAAFYARGAQATSGSTTQNSGLQVFRGQYWNGSSSTNFDVVQQLQTTSATPTGYVNTTFAGVEVYRIFNDGTITMVGAPATSGTTLVNSPTLQMQSNYWNGSASTSYQGRVTFKADTTAPAGHFEFNINGTALLNLNSAGTLYPNSNNAYSLGASSFVWANAYSTNVWANSVDALTTTTLSIGTANATTINVGGTNVTGSLNIVSGGSAAINLVTHTTAQSVFIKPNNATLLAFSPNLMQFAANAGGSQTINVATSATDSAGTGLTLTSGAAGVVSASNGQASGTLQLTTANGPTGTATLNGGSSGPMTFTVGTGGAGGTSSSPGAGANMTFTAGTPGGQGGGTGSANSGNFIFNNPAPVGSGGQGSFQIQQASVTFVNIYSVASGDNIVFQRTTLNKAISVTAAATDTAGNALTIVGGPAGAVSASAGKVGGAVVIETAAGVAGTAALAAGASGSITIQTLGAGANNGGGGANSGAINFNIGAPSGAGTAGQFVFQSNGTDIVRLNTASQFYPVTTNSGGIGSSTQVWANGYFTTTNTNTIDALTGVTLSIGAATATAITLGKSSINITATTILPAASTNNLGSNASPWNQTNSKYFLEYWPSSITSISTTNQAVSLTQNTAATSGVQSQYSPIFSIIGNAWNTSALASQQVNFGSAVVPVGGNPISGSLNWYASLNGGAYGSAILTLDNLGNLTVGNNLTVTGSVTFNGPETIIVNNLTTTQTFGLSVQDNTAATSGVPVQNSPGVEFVAQAWNSSSLLSQTSKALIQVVPTSGSAVATSLNFYTSENGAAYALRGSITSGGNYISVSNVFTGGSAGIGTLFAANVKPNTASTSLNIGDSTNTSTINFGVATGNAFNFQIAGVTKAQVTSNGNILTANLLDVFAAGQLAIGTVNATSISLGSASVTAVSGTAGKFSLTQNALSGTGSIALQVLPGAHTNLTASTEQIDVAMSLNRTVQFATGNITTQRAMTIATPTYSFVAASTITNAATLAITGAPVAGANATITNSFALWTQAGQNRFDVAFGTPALSINGTGAGTTGIIWSATGNYGWIDYDASSSNGVRYSALVAHKFGINSNAAYGTSTFTEAARVTSAGVLLATGLAFDTIAAGALNLGTSTATSIVLGGSNTTNNISAFSARFAIQQNVMTTPVAAMSVAQGAHTAITAGNESLTLYVKATAGQTWATGALATQRYNYFENSTINFAGASTVNNAATIAIQGAPVAGTNATITNSYALWVQAGNSLFGGGITVTSGNIVAPGFLVTTATGFDTNSAIALNIGATTATSITLGKSGVNTTVPAGASLFVNTIDVASGTTLTLLGTGNEILLNNATSNWIRWTNNGVGVPTFTTRSVGTKLVLNNQLGVSAVDYSLGVETGFLWFSAPQSATNNGFKFYGGTTNVAKLDGAGNLSLAAGSIIDVLASGTLNVGGANVSALYLNAISTTNTIVGNATGDIYLGGSSGASGTGHVLTWLPIYISGNTATAGTTLVNSQSLILRGRYWNGTASVDYSASEQFVVDSTTPTGHLAWSINGGAYLALNQAGTLYPVANNSYSIGSSSNTWANGWFTTTNTNSIVTATGTTLTIAGSGTTTTANGTWNFTGTVNINGSVATTITLNNLTTTIVPGLTLTDTTAATAAVPVQDSPGYELISQAWNTTALASQTLKWMMLNVPTSGSTVGSNLIFYSSENGAAYAARAQIRQDGSLTTFGPSLVVNSTGSGATIYVSSVVPNSTTPSPLTLGTANTSTVTIGDATNTSATSFQQKALSGTTGRGWSFTPGTHTALTASTENIDFAVFTNRTVTWNTGALTLQRFFSIGQPTMAFAAASTVTTAATFNIDGAPIAGANATLTNSFAIRIGNGGALAWDNVGVNPPSVTTRSTGTKLVLWNGVTGTTVDYAIGIDSATLWQSVNASDTAHFFKWYGGTVEALRLDSSGNMFHVAGTRIDTLTAGTLNFGTSTANAINFGNSTVTGINATSNRLSVVGNATTTGSVAFSVQPGNHTAITASTEQIAGYFKASSPTWATGALSAQRFWYFESPTMNFAAASTATTAATVAIQGAPAAGTNATITNPFALYIESGTSQFNGNIYMTLNSGVINMSGTGASLISASSTSYVAIDNIRSYNATMNIANTATTTLNIGTASNIAINIGASGGTVKINGVQINPASPSTNWVLAYNGTAFVPMALSGVSGVSGSGVVNEVAFFNGTNAITGSGNLTYASSILNVDNSSGIGDTLTVGLSVGNTFASTAGAAVQSAPALEMKASFWGGAASNVDNLAIRWSTNTNTANGQLQYWNDVGSGYGLQHLVEFGYNSTTNNTVYWDATKTTYMQIKAASASLGYGANTYFQASSTGTLMTSPSQQGIISADDTNGAQVIYGVSTNFLRVFNTGLGLFQNGTNRLWVNYYGGVGLGYSNNVGVGETAAIPTWNSSLTSSTDVPTGDSVKIEASQKYPAYGYYQFGGAARIKALPDMGAITITPTGGTTSNFQTYYVVAVDRNGYYTNPASASISNGPATFSATAYNTVSWALVPGAQYYDIYGNGNGISFDYTHFIGTVYGNSTSFKDTGAARYVSGQNGAAGSGTVLTPVNCAATGSAGSSNVTLYCVAAIDFDGRVTSFSTTAAYSGAYPSPSTPVTVVWSPVGGAVRYLVSRSDINGTALLGYVTSTQTNTFTVVSGSGSTVSKSGFGSTVTVTMSTSLRNGGHGLRVGDQVTVTGADGVTFLNGTFTINTSSVNVFTYSDGGPTTTATAATNITYTANVNMTTNSFVDYGSPSRSLQPIGGTQRNATADLTVDGATTIAQTLTVKSTTHMTGATMDSGFITNGALSSSSVSTDSGSWTAVTFQNSWTNYSTPTWAPAAYYKDAMGFVHLKGLIANGTLGSTAFTLPAGFRPANARLFGPITGGNTIGRIDINTNGTVVIQNVGTPQTWVTLEGITFQAEQ